MKLKTFEMSELVIITLIFSVRKGKKGGGTGSIFSTSFAAKQIGFYLFTTFEYHAFVFSSPSIICITVYRPPKKCAAFIHVFSEFLSILYTSYNMIIISGDFNVHTDVGSDCIARDFIDLLNFMDYYQHVRQPTHNNGRTLLLTLLCVL